MTYAHLARAMKSGQLSKYYHETSWFRHVVGLFTATKKKDTKKHKQDTLPKQNSNLRKYFNTISSFRKRNFKNEKIGGSKNGHYRTCRCLC